MNLDLDDIEKALHYGYTSFSKNIVSSEILIL